jgi:hypothetical protein
MPGKVTIIGSRDDERTIRMQRFRKTVGRRR